MLADSTPRKGECPHCHVPVAPSAKFCHDCGQALPELFCSCGARSPQNARFCMDCGSSLTSNQPSGTGVDELRPVTVLVTDLVNSTWFAEQLGPERFRDLLREMQSLVTPPIEQFGGYIAQFSGDGILAFFGYPSAQDHHARRAVSAGLGILGNMASFRRLDRSPASPRLQIRISCHTGPVIVERGPASGSKPPAEGAAIAVATRIQAQAEPGTLVISADTYRLVEEFFEVRPLGSKTLKGVSSDVALFQVEGASRRPTAPKTMDSTTRLVGRDSELAFLLEEQRRSEQGLGRAVFVCGEAGIGKSRLIDELHYTLVDRDTFSIVCQCDETSRRTSFAPFINLITNDIHLCRGGESSNGRPYTLPVLQAFLEAQGVDASHVFALEHLLVKDTGQSIDQHDAVETYEIIKEFIIAYILRRQEIPTTLIAEDVHWCDPSTKGILLDLIREGPRGKLLILLSARSYALEPDWLLHNASMLSLPPIDDQLTREMVQSLNRNAILDDAAVEALIRRSGGVPLFIEECFRAMAAHSPAAAGISDIPQRLQGVIWHRLDQLGEFKWIAQLASLIGQTFSRDLLVEAVRRINGEPEPLKTLRSAINALERAELISVLPGPRGERFRFRHALVRTAAYESLPVKTRRTWHSVMADVLDSGMLSDPVVASAEALARHRSAANQPQQAAKAYHDAGREAARRFANPEAIALFSAEIEEAKKLGDEGEAIASQLGARRALNAAIIARHGWASPELEANGTELLALAQRSGTQSHVFEAHRMLLNVSLLRADNRAASLHLKGMELAHEQEPSDDGEMVLDRCAGGKYLFLDGDLGHAGAALMRSMHAFDPERHRGEMGLHDLDGEVCVRSLQSWLRWFAGDSAGSIEESRQVIDLAHRIDHPFSLAYALCLGGSALLSAGMTDEVVKHAAEIRALSSKYSMSYWSAYAEILHGGATIATDAESAIGALRTARKSYLETGARMLAPWIVVLEAQALSATNRRAEARELLSTTSAEEVQLFAALLEQAKRDNYER